MTRRLALAFAFLTRLPVPTAGASEADVGRALAFFPVVGLALGVAAAALAEVLDGRLSSAAVAVAVVTLLAALTGGLHLDGVADTFDALGAASADRARRLEILRDSRIGAHGASALVLLLLGKVALVEGAVAAGDGALLVGFPAVARWTAVLVMRGFPYARERGLGSPFRDHARGGDLALATGVTLVVVLWLGGAAWLAALVALAVAGALAALATRRFGGLTGDVYGAAIELAELAFLATTAALDQGTLAAA